MKFMIMLILLFSILNVSAIRINEVELNPAGADTGAEWIELYSEEEIDLNNWKIANNDGDELELNKTFSGFLIIEFENQWLDNKDEKIFLYDKENLIDETDLFFDSTNNDKTYQFCDKWVFADSTKEKENGCSDNSEEQDEKKESEIEVQEKKEEEDKQKTEQVLTPKNEDNSEDIKIIELNKNENTIDLNSPQQITGEIIYESKNEQMKKYSVYAFALFLIFVIVILVLRK